MLDTLFFHIKDALKGVLEIRNFYIEIASLTGVLIALGIFLYKQLRVSFKLLRKFHVGRIEGNWRCIINRLFFIFIKHPRKSRTDLFRFVRLSIEYECLKPHPIRSVNNSNEDFKKEIKKWKDERKKVIESGKIELDHPAIIQMNFKEVDRYFDALGDFKADTVSESPPSFLIEAKIGDGFVAPLHLMTGLMQKFDEDWKTVIDAYEADLKVMPAENDSDKIRNELINLKHIQRFIFDCWLQWGQSIPLCSDCCKNFKGPMGSLQYGYGDEDNSIELIGGRNELAKMWQSIQGIQGILAARAKVTGKITSSRFFENNKMGFGNTLSESWGTDKKGDERLLIKVISLEPHNKFSNYYSAYVWAIFVILKKTNENNWVRASYVDEENKDKFFWRDIIPFFEHGNIAEESTFNIVKQQLAIKSITGLSNIVKNWMDKNEQKRIDDYPLRFAFSCSLDFSGCGCEPDFLSENHFKEHPRIPSLLKEAVESKAGGYTGFNKIILFDRKDLLHTCDLPRLIMRPYFNYAEEVNRKINEASR